MKYEVRCCCNPSELIGWLTVSDSQEYRIRALTAAPLIRDYGNRSEYCIEQSNVVSLPKERISFPNGNSYIAIKADHIEAPIELLRKIPSFIENTDETS